MCLCNVTDVVLKIGLTTTTIWKALAELFRFNSGYNSFLLGIIYFFAWVLLFIRYYYFFYYFLLGINQSNKN